MLLRTRVKPDYTSGKARKTKESRNLLIPRACLMERQFTGVRKKALRMLRHSCTLFQSNLDLHSSDEAFFRRVPEQFFNDQNRVFNICNTCHFNCGVDVSYC